MPGRRGVVEVLTHDHRAVEELFTKLEAPDLTPQARQDLVRQVTVELVRHSVAEEQVLYPTVRKQVPGGEAIADKELAEHAEVELALKDLEAMSPEKPEYQAKVADLIIHVREHVRQEEAELFPALEAAVSSEQLDEMGSKIEKAEKHAPTHPHPATPHRPPANKAGDAGMGIIDRVRDAITGHH